MYKLYLVLVVVGLLLSSSCSINSNLMFKEIKNGSVVIQDSIPLKPLEEYKIAVNDKISFSLSTKNGEKLIDQQIIENSSNNRDYKQEYIIKKDGHAELPILGDIKLEGYTISECETILEQMYADSYKNPFIRVNVSNKRVIVFPGNGSDAKVVQLTNPNTTLMEAIALAGGITDRGKAKSIKIMRKVNNERHVYKVDLSTLDGLMYADMIVQGNDYIYVEPASQISKELIQEIAPIITIISSAVVFITVITNLK